MVVDDLDLIGAKYLDRNIKALATNGRLVIRYGMRTLSRLALLALCAPR